MPPTKKRKGTNMKKNRTESTEVLTEPATIATSALDGTESEVSVNPVPEDEETDQADGDRRKKIPDLDDATEQILCEWFSDHPLFYDMTDPNFKNKQLKDRLLENRARELDMTAQQLAIWWKSQRTMYGRLHRTKSGQAPTRMTDRQKWNLNNFSFLKTHIAVRTTTKQLGKVPCHSHPEEEDEQPSDTDGTSIEIPPPDPTPQTNSRTPQAPKRNRKQTAAIDDAFLKLVNQVSGTEDLSARIDEVLHSSKNNRTAFSQWIAAETVSLSDHMFRRFQTDVFALVMKYNDKAAQQSQGHTVPNTREQRPSYGLLPRSASAPQTAWHLPPDWPNQQLDQDWSHASTPQQLLVATGLSSMVNSNATATDSRTADTGVQIDWNSPGL